MNIKGNWNDPLKGDDLKDAYNEQRMERLEKELLIKYYKISESCDKATNQLKYASGAFLHTSKVFDNLGKLLLELQPDKKTL